MDLLSYGDSIPEGEYSLHSAFAGAMNFRRGGKIVTLVPVRAGAGPVNLVLSRLPREARTLRASRRFFYLGGKKLPKLASLRYSSVIPPRRAAPEAVLAGASAVAAALARRAPARSLAFIFDRALEKSFSGTFEERLLGRFKVALAAFEAGRWMRGARLMRGLGFGLTPSGDDFISGMLTGFNYARRACGADTRARVEALFAEAAGGNLISNSFLRSARAGRVNARTGRLLAALPGGCARELEAAAAAALDSGHTSGADFCSGLVFALRDALRSRGRASVRADLRAARSC